MHDDMIDVMSQGGAPVVARIFTKTGGIESRLEIGDILEAIQKSQKEQAFLKEYKAHRVSSIDEKISKLDENIDVLRSAVLEYMQTHKETKIDFPDVGAVTARKTKGTFVIEDEPTLVTTLEKNGVLPDVASQQWKFDKKKLNKVLEEMKSNGNLPSGVRQEQDSTSLAISFADAAKTKPKASKGDGEATASSMDYDKISI